MSANEMTEIRKSKMSALGLRVLQVCRNELYARYPYLDGAFASLEYKASGETGGIGTDGTHILFRPAFLLKCYVHDPENVRKGYLHMLLHCLYLHPFQNKAENTRLWNLACDMAVEQILEREWGFGTGDGAEIYPLVRQRPILLMGPPGIGKTAVMEQIARECGVGLVAYTITHHTRQSAIGLPEIVTKSFDGTRMDVTEYTMSEIIASVYECMERTGKREGILFIDEINCVSETLAPTMLQFLQNKTFGSHKVPEGWMIVAAGNPSRYNKSVREFDIVTLDRVRKIDIMPDLSVWMEYAWKNQVHGAVLSYLSIKEESFYIVENTVDGKFFVTARGWEDLSELLKSYEELEIPVTDELMSQFLQKEEVARDFTAYYQLYRKYGSDYGIREILDGKLNEVAYEKKISMAKEGSFEERFTVTGLLLAGINREVSEFEKTDKKVGGVHRLLTHLKKYLQEKQDIQCIEEFLKEQRKSLAVKLETELISRGEAVEWETQFHILDTYRLALKKEHIHDPEKGFERIREMFGELTEERLGVAEKVKDSLERAFGFMERAFGDDQEMVLFVTGLTGNERVSAFIGSHGCKPYFKYSGKLLFRKEEQKLLAECRKILEK